jgi:hypothetical protein
MLRKIFLVLLIVLVLAGAGFVLWASSALGPSQQALAALNSANGVTVSVQPDWIVFNPEGSQPATGFIFYPGGRVDYRSYSPLLNRIAAQGYKVVLVQMPLNLAVFGVDKAADVMQAYPEVKAWAIGGHSLGGSMAAQFVTNHFNAVQGLVFWASYPAGSLTARFDFKALSISGSNDGLSTPAAIKDSRILLPDTATFVVISGGDHAQFGSYGDQPGDNPATISPEEQWQQTVTATVSLLKEIEP